MDSFVSLLCFMGSRTDDDTPRFDILGNLPPEMVINILRMLDPASLLSCALVNKSWMCYVRSHPELRSRVRRHLRRIRKERSEPLNVRIRALRRAPNGQHPIPPAPFAPTGNEAYEMRTIRSNRVSSPVKKHEPVVITNSGQSLMKLTLRKAKKATRNAVSNVLGLPSATMSSSSSWSSANACKRSRQEIAARRKIRI
ncbi:uncharacterized protein LOC124155551 isoform X3 [Ischnura elegans]|uniref:uncharacterized protein LOC124155551 isoform X3 n=3 Tax=Ischnura elegans TaxID=197161 RepID=UPI001ED87AA7|nr:uncharacterized protein LOC124155551 isoform X3 [Ischnura elegans]